MKKSLILISMIMGFVCISPATEAKNGDIIGKVYNTDIVVYINNYAIPSYAVNGTSCVVAEDLRNFGFDVVWNGDTRTLDISRNLNTTVIEMSVEKTGKAGSVFTNLLETDIVVYAGGTKIPSYALNGYTIVPVESLTMFGDVYWVAEQRALKLWVDNLHIRNGMQSVTQYSEPVTVNTSSSSGSSSYSSSTNVTTSYIGNASSKKFHRSSCPSVSKMKNSNKVYFSSRNEAVSKGYIPCKNCNP